MLAKKQTLPKLTNRIWTTSLAQRHKSKRGFFKCFFLGIDEHKNKSQQDQHIATSRGTAELRVKIEKTQKLRAFNTGYFFPVYTTDGGRVFFNDFQVEF